MFDLEAIGETQIGIGQRSSMVLSGHQIAGEGVADTKVSDERFAIDVLALAA